MYESHNKNNNQYEKYINKKDFCTENVKKTINNINQNVRSKQNS